MVQFRLMPFKTDGGGGGESRPPTKARAITVADSISVYWVRQNVYAFVNSQASYFQRADVNLPGIKKFFTVYSMDNRGHAEHLISYVNNRGGHVRFDEINVRKKTVG